MSGDLLDLILVVLAAAFAVAGYRQGFIVGVLSFAGFLGGAAVGAVVAPSVARSVVHQQTKQALVAIVVVFLAAMIGQLVASEQLTIVLVEQFVQTALSLADQAAIMVNGELVKRGTPAEIRADVVSVYLGDAAAGQPVPAG